MTFIILSIWPCLENFKARSAWRMHGFWWMIYIYPEIFTTLKIRATKNIYPIRIYTWGWRFRILTISKWEHCFNWHHFNLFVNLCTMFETLVRRTVHIFLGLLNDRSGPQTENDVWFVSITHYSLPNLVHRVFPLTERKDPGRSWVFSEFITLPLS